MSLKRIGFDKNKHARTRMRRSRMKTYSEPLADKKWKKEVKERDENTCQRCFKQGFVHAHHVAPRSRRPDLKHELSNGISVCFDCHQWIHNNPIEATELGLLSNEAYEKRAA